MRFPFGKDFTYTFYPEFEGVPVTPLAGQTPSIYIFDEVPTRDDAQNGTGAIQTITTWTEVNTRRRDIAVDAIDDPNPDSTIPSQVYWIAINFTLDTGEQAQTVTDALEMSRLTHHASEMTVTVTDLEGIYPSVNGGRWQPAIIDQAIETAKAEIKGELPSHGYKWATIERPDQLSIALSYKVIANLLRGERLFEEMAVYRDQYQILRDGLKLEIDADQDGLPDAEPLKTSKGYFIQTR